MMRVYKILLGLYPRDYKSLFGSEMLAVIEEAANDSWLRGRSNVAHFAVVECAGLVTSAISEWLAKFVYSLYHSNSYVIGRCLPNQSLMWPSAINRQAFTAAKTIDTTDESGMCVNSDQTFMFASPLRRLQIIVFRVLVPVHSRSRIGDY